MLINPASNPYLGMEMYLGKNTNYSTNEKFYLTKKDLEILELNNVSKIKSPSNYLVLIETGDDFKSHLNILLIFIMVVIFASLMVEVILLIFFKEKLGIVSKFMKL
ncbi:MAG: hypothetical protein Ct9H90mP6_01730 [Gammaproteobacteria bacterium]|nr:MAG: hypothetical protein Ct9H90mP6_01730 [Gammaproteobacteria bacterium]